MKPSTTKDNKNFAKKQKEVDQLILAKQFLAAYQLISDILQDKSLSAEQYHGMLNLQSNTRYAAEAQMILQVLSIIAPDAASGDRVPKDDVVEKTMELGGGFVWTPPTVGRAIDYLILHDMLPAHLEGDEIVYD
ncbi:MAG TPA: hypothetical protein VKK79_15305 [Candidatus Lokiarchaeia archaeon]|nr:hypothetical protein [Candidatus Lokiarchaeia archaeon]